MYLFLDTEFVAFNCPVQGLISLAATNERGESWYGVNKDFALSACSDFVREHVLPYLARPAPDVVTSLVMLGHALARWVEAQGQEVTVVIDYTGDWYLMAELFEVAGNWPANLSRKPVFLYTLLAEDDGNARQTADATMAAYIESKDWVAHNARADAEANWHAWRLSTTRQTPKVAA